MRPIAPAYVAQLSSQKCDSWAMAFAGRRTQIFVELDGKIERYQRMASRMTDQAMLDGIKKLIEQMKALKAALHSGQTG